MTVGETGVGEMGVGETGQIIGETGVGETGVGEMGVNHYKYTNCSVYGASAKLFLRPKGIIAIKEYSIFTNAK